MNRIRYAYQPFSGGRSDALEASEFDDQVALLEEHLDMQARYGPNIVREPTEASKGNTDDTESPCFQRMTTQSRTPDTICSKIEYEE